MARLPEIQPRGSVIRGPQSSVSPAEIANPYRQVASAFGSWSDVLAAKNQDDASIAGQNAVYTDANGNLQVDLQSNVSEQGRAYNRTAMAAYNAQRAPEIRAAAGKLSLEAKGDPLAFDSSWKGFRDQMLTNTPKALRGPIGAMIDESGTLQRAGIVDQKFRSDMTNMKASFLSEREFLSDQATSLAMQGGTDTPEYRSTIDKIRSLNSELTGNPVFAYSQREADIDMKRLEGRAMTESLVGQVGRAVKTGGIGEAAKIRDTILTDQNLALSPQERRTYFNLADSVITGAVAEAKANLKPLQARQTTMVKDILAGNLDINSPDIDSVSQDLARGGDVAGSLELLAARRRKIFADANSAQQVDLAERAIGESYRPAPGNGRPVSFNPDMTNRMQQAMQHYIARGVPPMLAAGIIGNLVQESSLNAQARNKGDGTDGSDSIGIGQWNGDRARALKDFAASKGASPDDLSTQLDFVLHELETSEGAAYQRLKSATNVDEATAAMIGYERPQGWSADNPRGGHGWSNRLAAASRAAQMQGLSGELIASQAPKFTADEVKEYREEITSDVRSMIPDLEAGIKSGAPFNSDSLNLLTRQLALVTDQDLRSQVANMLERNSVIIGAQDVAPAELESTIAALRQDISQNGATAAQLDLVQGLVATAAAKSKALAEDPIGYGVSRGYIPVPPDLNLADPQSWEPAFAGLQRGVDILRARREAGNISALRPEMQKTISRALGSATPEDSIRFLGAMSRSLDTDTYLSTLGAIYSTGDADTVGAAGALVKENPDIALGILRGQELLKQNPLLAPKKSKNNSQIIDEILPPKTFVIEAGRQFLIKSATARYADLSNQAGDTSGELDDDRMQRAITEVSGGFVEFNGQEIVAPVYGMRQGAFDTAMEDLTDDDLAGAVTSTGQKVTARDLRNEGRLRSLADGRYLLEFGPLDAPSYVMRQPSPGNYREPSAFVLDLRR